jgi:hypothetical protein
MSYFKGSEGMNIRNKTRTSVSRFFKLKNGQWLKIVFTYKSKINTWFMTIVVANSKRQCNDCINKTESSPKVTYGHITGNKCELEPFKIALKELLEFEKTVHNCEISVVGASERLSNIYRRLARYGYSIDSTPR